MDDETNNTCSLEEYENSTLMLASKMKMTDYMDWAIFSYIGGFETLFGRIPNINFFWRGFP